MVPAHCPSRKLSSSRTPNFNVKNRRLLHTQQQVISQRTPQNRTHVGKSLDGGIVSSKHFPLVPLHRFGSSIFGTPILLFLRLFYQASAFHPDTLAARNGRLLAQIDKQKAANPSSVTKKDSMDSNLLGSADRISTAEWYDKISTAPEPYRSLQVVSITWVKALNSPLSHEFIQFVVEDITDGARSRLCTERHEDGDWVFVGPDRGFDATPLGRHSLPMPLLSLIYNDAGARPSLFSLAKTLADVTSSRPGYNIMREMCWWYAEAVFEAAHARFGGILEEWKWARYRYSFIVKTDMIRRKELTSHAEEFMRQNVEEMSY